MTTKPKYPYPLPALIAHLEKMQESTQEREHIYSNLVFRAATRKIR